ncbi:Zn-dependent protease [Rivularia sp. PCC 7116]|uniref:site-2 protease family protein n=1 Tax=Rivularia sp. PCC 7116 TaxID=373994 RepID=UPI00029F4B74|nr:site-2 protease family protein [Rivularia sp. PCC 7116]AFY56993.1 Zn-dependent protease [Rivularia sp. PCC 7116]
MFLTTLVTHPAFFFRYIVIVIISICLHELAHGFAALSQGDDTPKKLGHITLNPVVHMGVESIIFLCLVGMSWGQMPVNPYKFRNGKFSDILVSAAGPLCNLALGFIFIALLSLFYNSGFISKDFLYLAARINLAQFIFNLLPIPPLDGFHIFSNIFPELKQLERSQMGAFGLMIVFLIPGFGAGLITIVDLIITNFLRLTLAF